MHPRLIVLSALLSSVAFARAADPALPVKLTPADDRVRVEIDGQLFTEYIFKGASRPYCYPILTVDGTNITRDFPMKETPGEDRDHPHHRALMFAHADVNHVDFWNEGTAGTKFPKGKTLNDGILETKSGDIGVIRVRNRLVDPDGKLICTDETTLSFRGTSAARTVDYEVTIHALPDAPLVMGDNKDGTMSIRVAQWMTLPHKVAKQDVPGVGHMLSATGVKDDDVWGTRAPWCDYYAPRNGKTYGVAIFDHPQNLRHPTWWMARGYGLFAANPFGQHDFEKKPDQPHLGDYTIPAGGSLTLRYRFYVHEGDPTEAKIGERYSEYLKSNP